MEQVKNESGYYSTAIYCRLSKDDEQSGESVSIETQKMLLQDYCAEHGYAIYEIYADDGFSGLNFNRPAFTRMLEDIDSGKVNLVITKDLSRLGRDYIQTGYYTDVFFSRKRIRYIAVNDGIDTIRDNNDIAPFKNILNDMYARDLSRKVKSAKRQRASKGYFISSQTPFGYKTDPLNRNRLVIDEEPAETVKEIFRLAIAGNTPSKISRILTEQEVITPSVYKAQNGDSRFERYHENGKPPFAWCYQTVRTILRDQVYVGDMVNHKYEIINYKTKERASVPREERIIVPDCHEPIVSREDFECVRQMLAFRQKPRKHAFDNVFQNIAFCSECGSRMTLMMKPMKNGLTPVLRCANHYNHPEQCRHNHYIHYDVLYEEILKRVRNIAKRLESGELLRSIRRQTARQTRTDKLETERNKITKRLQTLKKIIKKLYEDYAGDMLAADSYHEMLAEYTREQKRINERLVMVENELAKKDNQEMNVEKLQEVIGEYLQITDLNANILNRLIERIEVSHTVNAGGCKQQEINIVYRFIGAAD